MDSNQLPQDFDALIAKAEEIAELAGKLMPQDGHGTPPEALLRASIAAAILARRAYVAMLKGAKDSPLARSFVDPARDRRDHKEEILRRDLAELLGQFCLLLDSEELSQVTEYVLSITT